MTAFFICQTFNFRDMTVKELINQFCEFRGKCTTDDVVALNFAYDTLAPRWISVDEALPDRYKTIFSEVVIVTDGRTVGIDFYNHEQGEWETFGNPTHWMSLPEVPEKGGEE